MQQEINPEMLRLSASGLLLVKPPKGTLEEEPQIIGSQFKNNYYLYLFDFFKCCPYKLVQGDASVGRYVVATRDIKAGEIIIEESPVTLGPKQFTNAVCLGCHALVDGGVRCEDCQWPMCGRECSKKPLHQLECPILQV